MKHKLTKLFPGAACLLDWDAKTPVREWAVGQVCIYTEWHWGMPLDSAFAG